MPTGLGGEQLWISPTNRYGVSSFNDLSDASRTTYITNGTSIVSDTIEGGSHAIQFNGTSDTTSWLIDPYAQTGTFSWSAWFNSDTLSGTQSICGGNSWSSFNGGFLFTSGGVVKFVLNKGVSGQSSVLLVGTTSLSTNTWYHVCVKGDGTNAYLYLNGSLEVSGAFNGFGTPWEKHFRIGTAGAGAGDNSFGTSTHFFDGKIDDVRVYSRELNQSEITHLATARGVEGNPFKGLGDEQLWLCPSLNDSANDISGNNNNGVYQNGMGTVTDTAEGGSLAYDFDGTADYITYPIAAIDSANSTGSVSVWVKTASAANPGGHIIGGSDTATTTEWSHLRLDSGEPTVVTKSGGVVGEKQTSTSVNDSNWHHVCAVGDGSNYSIYIDGTLVSSSWIGTPRGDRWLGYPSGMDTGLVGALVRSSGTGNLFSGQMDDIRAYNRVLTQSEIAHLASSRGVQGHPTIKGLGDEKLWLCPSLNDSANDISGNGNHGVYQNGIATVSDTDATYGGTKAYFSNAQSQYVLVSDFGDSLNDTNSISMWVKSVNPWACVPVANGGIGYSTSIWQYGLFNSGASRLLWRRSANLTLSGTTPSNQWQHICIIRDNGSSTQEVYVDGVLDVTSASFTGTYGTNQTWFGFGNGIGTNEELYMDDIRTYGRVLTQEEIAHLAKSRAVSGSPYNLNGIKHLLSSFIHPLG